MILDILDTLMKKMLKRVDERIGGQTFTYRLLKKILRGCRGLPVLLSVSACTSTSTKLHYFFDKASKMIIELLSRSGVFLIRGLKLSPNQLFE